MRPDRASRRKRINANCKKCIFAVFDEKYGEFKCKKRCIRIYNTEKYKDCEFYNTGNKN